MIGIAAASRARAPCCANSPASPSRRRWNATPRRSGARSPPTKYVSSRVVDAPTLYLGLGTGVPARKTEVQGRQGKQPDGSAKTREAKLAVVWSCATPARPPTTPETIATRDTDTEPAPFARRIIREAERRGFDNAERRVILGDGAPWIWNFADAMPSGSSTSSTPRAICSRLPRPSTAARARSANDQEAARGPPRAASTRDRRPCRNCEEARKNGIYTEAARRLQASSAHASMAGPSGGHRPACAVESNRSTTSNVARATS